MRKTTHFWTAFALMASVALVASGVLGGEEERDPRNKAHKEALDALCTAHHSNEGFLPMTLHYPEVYQQVKVGEVFPVQLTVRDPWKHEIYDITARLDIGNATGFQFVVEGLAEPLERTETVTLERPVEGQPNEGSSEILEFEVEENATEIFVFARAPPGTASPLPAPGAQNVISMAIKRDLAGKNPVPGEGTANYKAARLSDPQQIASNGYGQWVMGITYDQGLDPEIDVDVGIFVFYNLTGATTQTLTGLKAGDALRETESTTITWNLMATEPTQDAVMDFRVHARTHFVHPAGTGAQDDGHYLRYTTMTVDAGGSFVRGQAAPVDKVPIVKVDAWNLANRLSGFTTALLVPLSMVTGGMFGKGSRRGLNKFTGGARKRVLWHSSVSWVIIGIAVLHLVLAIVETQFKWTKGLFWGGAGFLALVTLGITGYWQVRIIKRFSYRTWRHLHLWSAMMVFFMGAMHTFVDGSDLSGVREAVPFFNQLIWP